MKNEPRYTREEWEALVEEERAAFHLRAERDGWYSGSVVVQMNDPRNQFEGLLDAKLQQLKLSIMQAYEERNEGR